MTNANIHIIWEMRKGSIVLSLLVTRSARDRLCDLLDRIEITSRDVFDCWFFLKERTSINKEIVESRMKMPIAEYLDKCITSVQNISEKSLISGLGELTEGEMKNFVRHGLKDELISLLTMFKAFPSFS